MVNTEVNTKYLGTYCILRGILLTIVISNSFLINLKNSNDSHIKFKWFIYTRRNNGVG